CLNGHTLCSGCKPRVHNRCPTCRHELGNIRCLALEKVAASLELPCKYQSYGCVGIYPYYSKLKHESQCSYRPYSCPYAGSECTVVGDIPFLVAHLKDDHKVDMHSGSTFNHRYVKSNPHEVENATWMLTVLLPSSCFVLLVIFHFSQNLLEEELFYHFCKDKNWKFVLCMSMQFIKDEGFSNVHYQCVVYCSTIENSYRGDPKLPKRLRYTKLKIVMTLVSTLNGHEFFNRLNVFSCFGRYFCLHFEAFQLGMAPVYIAFLRFMGDDNEAKNYSYSLEVGGNGRKLIWQGVPRSIRDSHRKVRDSFDGLIIQRNMALFFSGGDRKELKLRVTGRIWKEQ
ncbi:hypothetical protein Goarm_003918, partial [Gossypium armourianum]|nr:hypothetical protein [Gossypium armourianum]